MKFWDPHASLFQRASLGLGLTFPNSASSLQIHDIVHVCWTLESPRGFETVWWLVEQGLPLLRFPGTRTLNYHYICANCCALIFSAPPANACLSFLPHSCDKISCWKQLKGERVCLPHGSIAGKSRWPVLDAVSHVTLTIKSKVQWISAGLLVFIQPTFSTHVIQNPGNGATHIGWVFPPQLM